MKKKDPLVSQKSVFLTLLFLTIFNISFSQKESVNTTVFLLANLIDIEDNTSFNNHLNEVLPDDVPFTVFINGDLVDMKKSKRPTKEDSIRLSNLFHTIATKTNGNIVVSPGDRDWSGGLKSLKKLEKLIKSMEIENLTWAMKKGCPGPEAIEINEDLLLITVNTEWWNNPYDRPSAADGTCKYGTERDFLIELENLVEGEEERDIIVAGHFPLKSLGEYGGNFPLKQHLWPPVYGSLEAGFRQNVGADIDVSNEKFDFIRSKIEDVVLKKGSVVYASGHEKNLQVLNLGESFMVNSGAISKAKYLSKAKNDVIFAEQKPGVVELIYYNTGKVSFKVHESSNTGFSTINETTILSSPCVEGQGIKPNTNFNPCEETLSSGESMKWSSDTTLVAGDYSVGKFSNFLLGQHYRKSWLEPVKVPYLNLDTTHGGLTVYQKGGGHQTTSLKIKGGDGREYAFRSVDKDPLQLLSYRLQGTIIARLFQDITSIQQPYGAMAVGTMLDATDILHVNPKLFVMPPSKDLGVFQHDYSNLLGMLEEKPRSVTKVDIPFAEADEIFQSRKLFRKMYQDHDHKVESKEYAKARMFDILIGDWGKHEDNWKWAGYNTEDGALYRPIPRDRDYVFSKWDGFLTYFADRKWALPTGENFGEKINDVRSLVFSALPADRRLLNELTLEDWMEAAAYVQDRITDEVIDKGMKSMPLEIYDEDGAEIAQKLKARRKDLKKYAEEFYEILVFGGVEVVGSNKKEYFEVNRLEDGSVKVQMYDSEKEEKALLYERTFVKGETKEIRLYGLGGEDSFNVKGDVKNSIRVRVIGGSGSSNIEDESKVKSLKKMTLVYEKSDDSKIGFGEETKQVDSWNEELYDYNRHRFGYNRYLPILAISTSSDQGFGGTLGVNFTRHNYVKDDYSSKHRILGTVLSENINILQYDGKFHHVIRKWDLEIGGLIADKNKLTYFYGVGNGTVKDDDLFDDDFYRVSYSTYSANAGLSKTFWKKSYLGFKFNYENHETEGNENTILDTKLNPSADDVFVLGETNITELSAELDLDFRDRASFAEKGARLYFKHESGVIGNSFDDHFGITELSFEKYSSTRTKNPITGSVKLGGSTSYNEDEIPFYKLNFLGQTNNLRGYFRNRFAGKSNVYANTELRVQLKEVKTSFLPLKYGLMGFYDVGRVYSSLDTDDSFHSGYGVGFYVVPLTENFAVTASLARSKEESTLILISIGATIR